MKESLIHSMTSIWLYSTMFFYTKFKRNWTYGIGPGHNTDCAQLDHHLSECGWQVNFKLLWGLNWKVRAINSYGIEGFINDEAEDDSQRRPMFQPLSNQLSDNCIQQLQHEVPPTWTSSNFGIDMYLKGLHIVEQYSFDS